MKHQKVDKITKRWLKKQNIAKRLSDQAKREVEEELKMMGKMQKLFSKLF